MSGNSSKFTDTLQVSLNPPPTNSTLPALSARPCWLTDAHFLISLVLFQLNSFIPCWAAMAEATYRRRSLIAIPSSPPRPRPPTPSPPSSPPPSPPLYLPPEWREWPQLQVPPEKSHHTLLTIIHHHLFPIKTLLNSRKRNQEAPRLDQMVYHSRESQEKDPQHIFGSFF